MQETTLEMVFGKLAVEEPLMAAHLVSLYRVGRITKDLLAEALHERKLALMIVRHETMHDIMAILATSGGNEA